MPQIFLTGTSSNKVKAALRQQFSLVVSVMHAVARLMSCYQQKGDGLQEFNFEFSDSIKQSLTRTSLISWTPLNNCVCTENIQMSH